MYTSRRDQLRRRRELVRIWNRVQGVAVTPARETRVYS
jgi:hypothetical protein